MSVMGDEATSRAIFDFDATNFYEFL